MITSLKLQNFRGFRDHTLPLGPMTVVVGQNNAGKTTMVEALRLLSLVTLRYRHLGFQEPPSDVDIPRRYVGVKPSLKNVEINFKTVFHQYGDPPAVITTTFQDSSSVTIYVLGERGLHGVIRTPNGEIVRSKHEAVNLEIPQVHIMPQVAPLQQKETILSSDYVNAAISSRLAPLHFRNQLRARYDLFPAFKSVVEETWPGVQVYELIGRDGMVGQDLHLEIRNESFVAEVAEMGHGLQMWLQTMWFLTLSQGAPTVILDEPDVYMHADVQRRIIRFLRNRHEQTIITTHSVEIMSEVNPDEILVVDKKHDQSVFAGSVPAVQTVVNSFGSVHNVHLTRLLGSQRMILVEGKDLQFLKEFQDTLFPNSKSPFQSIPNMPIGGWSGWKYAIGSSMGFHNALGQDIRAYCILDSDYHSLDEIGERYTEAGERGVQLHIWSQKELENFLLQATVILRVIAKRAAIRTELPTPEEVQAKLVALATSMENDILDAMATEYWHHNRILGQAGANRAARERIRISQQKMGNILPLASGKEVLSRMSEWSKGEFGVSFSGMNIVRAMTAREIPPEVEAVVAAIERRDTFPGRGAT